MPAHRFDKQRSKWFEREPTWRCNVAPSRVAKVAIGKKPPRKPIQPKK